MEFKSFREFKEYYFPKIYEKERIDNMGSDEHAKYIAEKLADRFKTYLEK